MGQNGETALVGSFFLKKYFLKVFYVYLEEAGCQAPGEHYGIEQLNNPLCTRDNSDAFIKVFHYSLLIFNISG